MTTAPAPDDLVTEEMVTVLLRAVRRPGLAPSRRVEEALVAALRAVAPMIAARAVPEPLLTIISGLVSLCREESAEEVVSIGRWRSVAGDDFKHFAADMRVTVGEIRDIAAAIRARGAP
jgi:hypothetical protein